MGAVRTRIGRIEPTAQLSGLDISPEQTATAQHHRAELGLRGVALRVGDAAALPWPDGAFDRVRLV